MIHHARYELNNDVVMLNINRRPFNYRSVSTSETCSNQTDLGREKKQRASNQYQYNCHNPPYTSSGTSQHGG